MESARDRWKVFYDEGIAYYGRAVIGNANGYTPELLHGIVSMAAEKLLMALIVRQNRLPEGHTFTELLDALPDSFDTDGTLRSDLSLLDDMIPLCSLDPAQSWKIPAHLALKIIPIAEKTRAAVDNAINTMSGLKQ